MKSRRWSTARRSFADLCGSLLVLLLASVLASSAWALDARRSITQLRHTAWTLKDGGPGQVTAIAQTVDGYLWLGTPVGLFRFDGVRFQRFEPIGPTALSSEGIFSLAAGIDGALWVGYSRGGVSRIDHGEVRTFTSDDGLTSRGAILRLSVAPNGSVWAITLKGLFRYADGRWADRSLPEVLKEGVTHRSLLIDAAGNVWVALSDGVHVMPVGASAFVALKGDALSYGQLVQAPDGRVWVWGARDTPGMKPLFLPGESGGSLDRWWPVEPKASPLWDRDGVLWFGRVPGITRVRLPAESVEATASRADGIDTEQGLSGDFVQAGLEDREGNLWFGTNGGLDRFRAGRLIPVDLPRSAARLALTTDPAGGVRVSAWNQGVFAVGDRASLVPEITYRQISALHQGAHGVLYLGGTTGLYRFDRTTFEPMPYPPGVESFGSEVQSLAEDPGGALWVAARIAGVPLFRVEHGTWTAFGGLDALPRDIPQVMLRDDRSRMWFGYAGDRIARLQDGVVTTYGSADGLAIGNAAAFAARGERLWAAGGRGLFGFDGTRFREVRATDPDALNGSSGLVETASGDLWLNTNRGIVHLRKADLDRAWSSPGSRVPFERFDWLDGLPGNAEQVRPIPTAVEDAYGRLWFAQTNGLVAIDPEAPLHNRIEPRVIVERVKAADTIFRGRADLHLPVGTTDLAFDYTATSLTLPERVTFRYRLEGLDKGWQEAGTRRQAFYTHLSPGRYRFSVMAANEDGLWGRPGQPVDIELAPAFHQTPWFAALVGLALMAAIWLAYRMRLRQMDARLHASLTARQSERERIASELHDTLLQNVQALIMVFHAAAARAAPDTPDLSSMHRALDEAERVLLRGRTQLAGMQAPIEANLRLGRSLRDLTEEFAALTPARFTVSLSGDEERLLPEIRHACYWTAREALFNAARHADARTIDVALACEPGGLRLRVTDDGRGIPAEVLEAGPTGHLGIPIMRARAGAHRGTLDIRSVDGEGTVVELWLPASTAFAPRRPSVRRIATRVRRAASRWTGSATARPR